ncbi:DUF1850 domain-containing protein [Hydrogenophaga sp.]|uniref:DUF1850 domain-containing protein n=1 Tax=Hydrogenophaga sp. TaxID=1904254 RepID=UPI002630B414|nr:DUF1850 domain-containing protein [Hydrogenophaga sp.]MDM7949495.1 DUF1850 domain-containing protein [Hydrogenophaga sp.]
MALLGVCLALAAAGPAAVPVFVPVERFTLAWTHSIEKVRWEEDYAVVPGEPPTLKALTARVRGSAAGMEPPADAVLRNGWYEYTPTTWSPDGLRLTRSVYTADYDWCTAAGCAPMHQLLRSDGGITLLTPCNPPPQR